MFLSCPSTIPPACILINSCLEADTSSFTDHSLSPPAFLGLPPSRPYSLLSWMTLTASFCQSTLCVTGRTICFKNKSDQISPLPKNLETLRTASGGDGVVSCGLLASYRTQQRRHPKGEAEHTPGRSDPSMGLHSSGLTCGAYFWDHYSCPRWPLEEGLPTDCHCVHAGDCAVYAELTVQCTSVQMFI